MRLLLDTHALLWWLSDDPALSAKARDAIANPENLVYVSAVNVWEIVVKRSIGKLDIPDGWAEDLAAESFRRLPITWDHALRLAELPDLHRDPFDRLLIAQALVEDLVIVTHDDAIHRYGLATVRT